MYHRAPPHPATPTLTPREATILTALAEGLTERETAVRLYISVNTVTFYRAKISTETRSTIHSGLGSVCDP